MNSLKRTLCIILVTAVIGFVIYKTYWKNSNIPTEDDKPLYQLNKQPVNQRQNHNIHEDESPEYCQYVRSIQSNIDKNSEIEILQCYRDTGDLRAMLLDKKIKASDIIHSKHLLPKNIKIPKVNNQTANKVDPNVLQTAGQPAHIKESMATITQHPDFFENHITKPHVPTADNWGSN